MGIDRSRDREGSGKDLNSIIYKTLLSSDKNEERKVFGLTKDRQSSDLLPKHNQIFINMTVMV